MMKVTIPGLSGFLTGLLLFGVVGSATVVPVTASAAKLEEIIVTAQRRQQNLQDVPITITPLSGERLTNIFTGADDIRGLAVRLPGLYAESSNGRLAPRFYIRGLGNTDFDLAASQPVSVVVDEVVQENVILKGFPIFDLDRVEVLKGPQGSLFGRNTPGGIVKLETVKPAHETSGYVNAAYGTYETFNLNAAIGGSLVPDVLAGRISVLYQDRAAWVENKVQSDDLSGFTEFAWRGQLLWTPGERLRVQANLHGRDYEGNAAEFRANIIARGSDSLVDFFERDSVTHDAGNTSAQQYQGFGGSLRVEYDIAEDYVFKSITAYEQTDGSSRGDVDGGSGFGAIANPAPIPFPSDTEDGIEDLAQFTQEFSVAHDSVRLDWQAGLFFFDSTLDIKTSPFFVPSTTVRHENQAWAVFGQATWSLTDDLQITVGARYTDDQKDLEALQANGEVAPESVDGSELSFDVALSYVLNDQFNLYARVAHGFRAPTIQGRDVAFGGPVSVADSETITSWEGGFKSELFDNRLRLNAVAFYYFIEDQQLSAIGGAENRIQLVNADEGEGRGFEIDLEWLLSENLLVSLGYSLNETELKDSNLRIGVCGSGICTVRDPIEEVTNDMGVVTQRLAIVDGNPFPHAPRDILYVTVSGSWPIPIAKGSVFFAADYSRQGDTEFFLYDSEEFQSSGNFELGARVGYRAASNLWEVALFGRNITDEENLKGGIDFNNNTAYLNEPRIIGVSFKLQLRN